MSSFNRVILMGNLTRDPEMRFTNGAEGQVAIVKFGLACNRRFKGSGGEWQDEATFVDVTMFGKRGEAFAKFHEKGKRAFVEGELRFDTWESKEGEKRSKLYVVANSFEFVDGNNQGEGSGERRQAEGQQRGQQSQRRQQQQGQQEGFASGGGYSNGG